MDFAGPIYVKDVFAKKGDMNKVYIALFTCAATRAVHLELVPNRNAVVRVKSGNSSTAEWRRPLQRLYPLEVKLDTEAANPVPQLANVPVRVVRDEDVPVVVVNSD